MLIFLLSYWLCEQISCVTRDQSRSKLNQVLLWPWLAVARQRRGCGRSRRVNATCPQHSPHCTVTAANSGPGEEVEINGVQRKDLRLLRVIWKHLKGGGQRLSLGHRLLSASWWRAASVDQIGYSHGLSSSSIWACLWGHLVDIVWILKTECNCVGRRLVFPLLFKGKNMGRLIHAGCIPIPPLCPWSCWQWCLMAF